MMSQLKAITTRRFPHPLYPTVMYGVIGTALCWLGLRNDGKSAASIALLLLLGMFSWTLVEYFLHRFIFHLTEVKEPWRGLASGLHMAHHRDIHAKDLIVAPPFVSFIFASIIFLIFWSTTQSFSAASLLISGLFAGYCAYEWVHYAAHHYQLNSTAGRYLKKYHLQHHHKHPNAGFGVTSPMWDRMFGTFPR